MALSTRARIAGVGGALAIGLLGAGGVAYATGGDAGTPAYVTVVDESTAPAAPAAPGGTGSREDCPEGSGGSGSGSGPESGAATVPGDA